MHHVVRALRALLFSPVVLVHLLGSLALATPVYLRPDSRFPSGNYQRDWLEDHTNVIQFQRWYRVQTRDKAFGWVSEDHVLTPLKLASEAKLAAPVPARAIPQMDAILGRPTIAKDTRLRILEISGYWVRVLGPINGEIAESWVPTDYLNADTAAAPNKAYVHTFAMMRVMPSAIAHPTYRVRAPGFIQVLEIVGGGMLNRESAQWLHVRQDNHEGYIPRTSAWLASDLSGKNVRPLYDFTPLRSAAVPYADVLRTVPVSATLAVVSNKTVRWGSSKIRDLGAIWWPMSDEFDDDMGLSQHPKNEVKIGTASLFSRKIFDIAASKAIPNLKFASAQGVFRTVDGDEWTKLAIFQDKNYPIAIASGGPIFIGPFVSDDQGETFNQWVKWDSLVQTLEKNYQVPATSLQILEIKPLDATGHRVKVRLSFGDKKARVDSAKLQTDDQGTTWTAL